MLVVSSRYSSVNFYHHLLKTFFHCGSAHAVILGSDRGNVSNRPSAATEGLSWQGHRLHASMETCNLVVCIGRKPFGSVKDVGVVRFFTKKG